MTVIGEAVLITTTSPATGARPWLQSVAVDQLPLEFTFQVFVVILQSPKKVEPFEQLDI